MSRKKTPRLQFTDAEQDGSRLKEHDRAKEREADRAAMRKDAPPKGRKKLKRRMIDQKSAAGRKKKGKSAAGQKTAKTEGQLQFEENRAKPPSKLSHAVKTAPVLAVSGRLHHEISEAEEDNIGLESAHRLEQTAETGVHLGESTPPTSRHFKTTRSLAAIPCHAGSSGRPSKSSMPPQSVPGRRQRVRPGPRPLWRSVFPTPSKVLRIPAKGPEDLSCGTRRVFSLSSACSSFW